MAEINKDSQGDEVQSPCIGLCVVDEKNNLCQGCFRTLDEIRGWWDLDNAKKKTIVEEASQREGPGVGTTCHTKSM
ncbi:MAG: DUF1289 domain-containing protein [Methylophilaceae bacterium]|jgi:predicted Fe-S protein YdhL (DUF1289 family)